MREKNATHGYSNEKESMRFSETKFSLSPATAADDQNYNVLINNYNSVFGFSRMGRIGNYFLWVQVDRKFNVRASQKAHFRWLKVGSARALNNNHYRQQSINDYIIYCESVYPLFWQLIGLKRTRSRRRKIAMKWKTKRWKGEEEKNVYKEINYQNRKSQ